MNEYYEVDSEIGKKDEERQVIFATTGSGYFPPVPNDVKWHKIVRPIFSMRGITDLEYGEREFNILSIWRDKSFMESSAGLTVCGVAIGVSVRKVVDGK